MAFTADFKLGHYMKIVRISPRAIWACAKRQLPPPQPPRVMFFSQVRISGIREICQNLIFFPFISEGSGDRYRSHVTAWSDVLVTPTRRLTTAVSH